MGKVKSNIDIRTNIYSKKRVKNEKDFYRILPSDVLYRINPSYFDVRVLKQRLSAPAKYRLPTDKQLEEYRKKLICCVCGRPCAGLCSVESSSNTYETGTKRQISLLEQEK